MIAYDNLFAEKIKKDDIKFYDIGGTNRSINPLGILKIKKRYKKIIKKENPDIVFTFMLKPNTFGVIEAKKAGIKNIYSMVEGAGMSLSIIH